MALRDFRKRPKTTVLQSMLKFSLNNTKTEQLYCNNFLNRLMKAHSPNVLVKTETKRLLLHTLNGL